MAAAQRREVLRTDICQYIVKNLTWKLEEIGSQILMALQKLTQKPTIYALVRRDIPVSSNTQLKIQTDPTQWSNDLKEIQPAPDVFLSALGTTRAQAGSLAAQRAIDYDLNLSLARTAKESGIKTYVLISAAHVSTKSMFPYSRMKAELEDAVMALEIPYTVIVRPGLLVGTRKHTRFAEAILQTIAKSLGMISKTWLMDCWAQDVDVIGRAAVAAALGCSEGKRKEGVWILEQSDIVRLGKDISG
ncbi:MAG: hypothetical protein L6R35_003088 [Caloplaca aegaea]|nr:MAG: hypothetical protein L6R35_003088 [Caloplaca aegaea]